MIAWLTRRLSRTRIPSSSPLAGVDVRQGLRRWTAVEATFARHPLILALIAGTLLVAMASVPPDRLLAGRMRDLPLPRISDREHARAGALKECFTQADAQSWILRERCTGADRGVAP